MTDEIDFYEVVEVLDSPAAAALGVAGTSGVVVGKSGTPAGRSYAVLVGDMTYMLHPSDLAVTGRRVDRAAVYPGESIIVSPQRYPKDPV